MTFQISPATATLEPSATLALNERARQLQAEGRTIFHLGFGESRFPVHPRIIQALEQHAGDNSYPPVYGLPELREAIATFYQHHFGIQTRAEQVMVGPGSKSLIFGLMQVLEGDVLIPRPAWVSYAQMARFAGKQVTWMNTHRDEEYCLSAEQLLEGLATARAAGADPRLLVLNNPVNPTGVGYPEQVLRDLAQVARDNRLVVISDEIYALLAHEHRPHVSFGVLYPEGTIVTGGSSKHLSLGGWRLGVAVFPDGGQAAPVLRALGAVAGMVWSGPTTPVQHAATVAYSGDAEIESYIRRCTWIHETVTHSLYDELVGSGLPCPRPSGGYYLYPSFQPWQEMLQVRHGVSNSTELAGLLLDEQGLVTLAGEAFGAPAPDLSVRLATSLLSSGSAILRLAASGQEERGPGDVPHEALQQGSLDVREGCPEVYEVGRRFRHLIQNLE